MTLPYISFIYRNHRGEIKDRRVSEATLEWIPRPGFGYQPGWFIVGHDLDKDAPRSFALCNIVLSNSAQSQVLMEAASQ